MFSKRAVLLLLLFILSGCVGFDSAAVIESIRTTPKSGAYIEGVPFFAQDTQMCGPAALASVLGYYKEGSGSAASLEEIAAKVFSEKLDGTLSLDMLLYARSVGFNAEVYSGGFEDLKEKLDRGVPLILFINLGVDLYPIGHYIVLVGYSDTEGVVIAHSGLEREEVYSYGRLKRAWKRTGFSTLSITPGAAAGRAD